MGTFRAFRTISGAVTGAALFASVAFAHDPLHRERVQSRYGFAETIARLQSAVSQNGLGIVTQANAQNGAKSLGEAIPGNQVWGLFGPKYAVRMLKASVDAGIEAPVRLYITEAPDGKVSISYMKPTDVFAPYGNKDLNAMAAELDALFARIVQEVR
jgi:uncharacterized protein (DUF302 family)